MKGKLLAIQFVPIGSSVLDARAETSFILERLRRDRRPGYLFIRTSHQKSLIVSNNPVIRSFTQEDSNLSICHLRNWNK